MQSSPVPAQSVVLVTGGAKGVGRGISECFLAQGADVIVCGREAPDVLPAVDGRSAHFYTVVSRDTLDQEYAAHRQRFLAEQGYAYTIVDADDVLSGG